MQDVIDALETSAIEQIVPVELPDEDQLVEVEEAILLPLPRDFKNFLLSVSNLVVGSLEPVTVSDPYAHTHLPEVTATAWSDGMPRDLIAICPVGSGYYCMDPYGEVQLWQAGELLEEPRWDDIWQWAEQVWLRS